MNLLQQETRPTTSYRLIKLTQEQYALVSECDYEWLNQWNWQADWDEKMQSFYAKRRGGIRMHRQILGLKRGDPNQGDHRNGDTLDNRRSNLRICTQSQNKKNARKRRDNTSGVKGVDFHAGKWRVRINENGQSVYVGKYNSKEDARNAYRTAATRLHGEFAHLG